MLLKALATLLFVAQLQADPIAAYRDEATKWEPDIAKLEAQNNDQVATQEHVLFLGSSSIRLWDSIEKDLPNHNPVRRGYGGARFSDLAVYIDRLIAGHDPQAVVIFVANDISGDKEKDKEPEEVVRLSHYVVERIRTAIPTAPIFFIEITPTPKRFSVWGTIEKANDGIASLTKELPNTYFISTRDHYFDESGLPISKYFQEDLLHLNAEGYAIWGKIIDASLSKQTKEETRK